jgi:hypothetical protein
LVAKDVFIAFKNHKRIIELEGDFSQIIEGIRIDKENLVCNGQSKELGSLEEVDRSQVFVGFFLRQGQDFQEFRGLEPRLFWLCSRCL